MRFVPLALAIALAATIATTAPARALDFKAMSPDEKTAFGAEVRSYLLDHPEVILAAVDKLKQKQAEAQAANDTQLIKTNAAALFHDPNSWVSGNQNGDVTLVEFMDYHCGYCRKAYAQVDDLVKQDGNIRYIVKEFPILGQQSLTGARFAIAVMQAAGPKAYAKAHDALMTFRGDIDDASMTRLAGQLGLDATDILKRMDSPEVTRVITGNRALAGRMQIKGTPTFVLGDMLMRGYVPGDQLAALVKQVRAE